LVMLIIIEITRFPGLDTCYLKCAYGVINAMHYFKLGISPIIVGSNFRLVASTMLSDATLWNCNCFCMLGYLRADVFLQVGSTFFRRLGWSPCGHFIATTHGFQNPSHTAPVLERGEWMASFDFVGHNAPVVAVRFNHSMFRKVEFDMLVSSITGLASLEWS